jgi:hypothetical protein
MPYQLDLAAFNSTLSDQEKDGLVDQDKALTLTMKSTLAIKWVVQHNDIQYSVSLYRTSDFYLYAEYCLISFKALANLLAFSSILHKW